MIADVPGSDLLAERTGLSLEERYSLLADPHRRIVLKRLDRASNDLTIETLADHVVSELTDDGTLGTDDERRRALFALHHNHLPRLDDHGVLEYDPDAGTATVS